MIALTKAASASFLCLATATVIATTPPTLLNDPVDVSGDFRALENTYYLADKVAEFDPEIHSGKLVYQRAQYHVRHAFDNDLSLITPVEQNEFPAREYAANPELPFSIDFVSPRTLRIRMTSGPQVHPPQPELMLDGPVPMDHSWKYQKVSGGWRYASAFGSVTIQEAPFHIEIRDANGRLLTETDHADDNKSTFSPVLPFGFVRRTADYSRSYN
ncbi:MAG TPA: alpha-xylosidase, partial [Candidatus Binatia bacterium]|nr:alpha-xylosidase [Candidatus Binatia bacterium]